MIVLCLQAAPCWHVLGEPSSLPNFGWMVLMGMVWALPSSKRSVVYPATVAAPLTLGG